MRKEFYSDRYQLISWLFLRALGLIYFAAFVSMEGQIQGLIGSGGILPIHEKLSEIYAMIGNAAYWHFPTVFWISSSDFALTAVCLTGAVSSLFVVLDFLSRTALMICFLLYLSITVAGQDFTTFQWDTLLLESGFLAIFLTAGSRIIIFLYRWLLFRFMFMSGVVKIASGDATWSTLRALAYHFETQPLPSPLAWYAHHLPMWMHQLTTAGVLLIELIIPFFIFLPRRFRLIAGY
ncbi:lipase maturation factor family protein, partial [bacterium]|nr:lipase maturation factor family protein [bacterium]